MVKRTGDKYEAIINAAVRVIAEYGYHNAQVSKIAREAKVADGTIYLYFKNKDDVLISVFREKMGAFITEVEQELEKVSSPVEQLYHLIRLHLNKFDQNKQLAIVMQIELRQSNPEVRKGIGKILKRYTDVIDRIVESGIEQGVFRPDLDVRIVRRMIFGTLDETVTSWIMNDYKYSLVEQTEQLHRLFVQGIGK
ncbi:TetR/AcrR family transcriptional regulator [Thermoflavimicrobium dichotomicum]|uniref:TetR/AcrR family transcriptional regulator, fatty acid metabolism regulator protein n=1 Tax=Thermoflavimicrobium dichotomicum TaxID=46223 RepID=A0A1I3L657_9BACL|nr:TetR/AcrR family transcriptional regulator [Thermoflavimicrobium dichotomicum]SFI80253.1 TetR/AcrR family transcriptional regulator, fatty acid metabolism regulator protein [Thermoflavimicrobium dichotomicum]